jgi:hypothetical protein
MEMSTTSSTTPSAAFAAAMERAALHPDLVAVIVTLRRQGMAFHKIVKKVKEEPVFVALVCHRYGLARDRRAAR